MSMLEDDYGWNDFRKLNVDNAKLREQNAKLRECLQDFADAIKNDDGFGVDQGWMLDRMRELKIEVPHD